MTGEIHATTDKKTAELMACLSSQECTKDRHKREDNGRNHESILSVPINQSMAVAMACGAAARRASHGSAVSSHKIVCIFPDASGRAAKTARKRAGEDTLLNGPTACFVSMLDCSPMSF